MELVGRKTLVLGAGRSGIEASKFLSEKGAIVALHDQLEPDQWQEAARSLKTSHNVGLLTGRIPSWLLDQIGSERTGVLFEKSGEHREMAGFPGKLARHVRDPMLNPSHRGRVFMDGMKAANPGRCPAMPGQ